MGIQLSYLFDNPLNYTFDPTKLEIVGDKARLKLRNNAGIVFPQEFAASTGFTFDALKIEFSGGVMRQLDKRASGATFYAPFITDNAAWGGGSLIASMYNGAAAVGGVLDLSGTMGAATAKYCDYLALNNGDSALQGAIRFRIKSNGNPSAGLKYIFAIGAGASLKNKILLTHNSSGGNIGLRVTDNNAADIIPTTNIVSSWQFTVGTWYEFELNYDLVNGATRLFINGNQVGSTITTTSSARTNAIYYIRIGNTFGVQNNCNNFYDYFMVFNSVQHTANYTPNIPVEDTVYLSDIITAPEMEYTGVGALLAATSFAASIAGSMRMTIQIARSGDYLYWDGSAWSVSNNTYSQSNTDAEILANIATLPVSGEKYLQFRYYTLAGNTQASIDSMSITATGQIFATDNPTIEPNSEFRHEDIETLALTYDDAGGGEIRLIFTKNGVQYYHNGTAWAVSDGTYAKSNTIADAIANVGTLTSTAVETKWIALLHSATGEENIELEEVDLTYNYSGETPDQIDIATVWGYMKDFTGGALEGRKVKCWLVPNVVTYKNTNIRTTIKTSVTNADGYFEFNIAETSSMGAEAYYVFEISEKQYRVKVPSASTYNLSEMDKI
jgi:hypothetical protein